MAKPEWGLKRTCLGCSERFYDMQRDPIVCPSCEAEFDPLALVRPRRARAAAASQAKAKAKAKAAEALTLDDTADSENAAEVVEDEALEIDVAASDIDDDDIIPDDDDDDTVASDPDVFEVLDKAKDDNPNSDN